MKNTITLTIIFTIGVFIGSAASVYYMVKREPEVISWGYEHQKEVQWAKDRYELMQKAASELYFDDEDKGITIVKPWIKEVDNEPAAN